MNLCFIDTETTGLYPSYGDRICELALIRTDSNFAILDKFDSLINPQREISPEAFQVNRIDRNLLARAPLFQSIANDAKDFLRDCYLVGHNVDFDDSFIRNEFRLAGIDYRPGYTLDTRGIARELIALQSYGLSILTAHFGIKIENRHRAMGDCQATLELFRELARTYQSHEGGTAQEFIHKFELKVDNIPIDVPNWLVRAIADKDEVEIEYSNRENQISQRKIRPLSVYADRGRTYLEAFCALRRMKLTFLLDRIKKIDYLS